jgi:hypothetical protein
LTPMSFCQTRNKSTQSSKVVSRVAGMLLYPQEITETLARFFMRCRNSLAGKDAGATMRADTKMRVRQDWSNRAGMDHFP